MNILETQRFDDLIKAIDHLTERLDDLEHYVKHYSKIEKKEEPVEEIVKKPFKSVVKVTNYFEKSFYALESLKGLWREKENIDFENFPSPEPLKKRVYPQKNTKIPQDCKVVFKIIQKLIDYTIKVDKDVFPLYTGEVGSPIDWYKEMLKTYFDYTLNEDVTNTFDDDKSYDFIDLLCILHGITEIWDHVIQNRLNCEDINHVERYLKPIEEIYTELYNKVLSELLKNTTK